MESPQDESQLRFFVEASHIPIYQRIITQLTDALRKRGHTVVCEHPGGFPCSQAYLDRVRVLAPDFFIFTNPFALLASYSEESKCYVFEQLDGQFIFLHHDNLLSNLLDRSAIQRKLTAFRATRERSWHFCLEYHNFVDLRSLGIERVYSIGHAPEFQRSDTPQSYLYDASFVGHVLPGMVDNSRAVPFSHQVNADIWSRIANMDRALEPSATFFAERFCKPGGQQLEFFAWKYFYISLLHLHSQHFRGEVLKKVQRSAVDIFGGDPSYVHGKKLDRVIDKENIRYHAPVHDASAARQIFAGSKINLNITPLQFDDAVINRVIDVGGTGGFVLTDWKPGLQRLTLVAEQISYRTIEELNNKLQYYLHPDHEQERLEIAAALHQDVTRKCSYQAVVASIVSKIGVVA